MCSVKGMVKMASKKRRREDLDKRKIWSDFDKENEDPDISSYLPRKIVRIQSQTSTSSPLKGKDGNVGSSLDGRLVFEGRKAKSGEVQEQHEKRGHVEKTPRVSGEEGVSSGEGLKQDGELTLPDKNHENISPRRVDHYYPKVYKTRSPLKSPKKSSTVAQRGENKKIEALEQLGGISAVLQERGKSTCLVKVVNVCQGKKVVVIQGTGSVWVDRVVVTSAHLLRDYLNGCELKDDFFIKAVFNNGKHVTFTAEKCLIDIFDERDIAFFQLKLEGYKPNKQRAKNFKLPPGVLRYLARKPKYGIGHIIAHDAGRPKRYEMVRIIEIENRRKVVNDHLAQFKDSPRSHLSVWKDFKKQEIVRVMEKGDMAEYLHTYLTSMKNGSSGAIVFDDDGNCFGLHTGEFKYRDPNNNNNKTISVMAYAYDLYHEAECFVSNRRECGDVQMLERLELLALENPYLKQILDSEPMEVDQ